VGCGNGSIFGTEITGEVTRMGDIHPTPGRPGVSDAAKNPAAHVEPPILAGHRLTTTTS
jgi:hypothetical protein